MKKSTTLKKLQLHRETVRQLSQDQLRRVEGGIPETFTCLRCPSSPTIC